MFELHNVKYKDILDIEKMTIPGQKITCLVGQSGAGKTTLLRMLNLMISPDEGEIYFQEKNLNEEDAISHRRRVVMAPQQPTIFEGTIRDNLNIGLVFSENQPKDDRELKEALRIVSLKKELDEEAGTLSGGEKQRLSLARVYLMEPEVFLLDEPTSALDEETEHLVMKNFIQSAKQKNQTIVLITHSPQIADTYCENKIILKRREEGIV